MATLKNRVIYSECATLYRCRNKYITSVVACTFVVRLGNMNGEKRCTGKSNENVVTAY